jgi:hypothetical protein
MRKILSFLTIAVLVGILTAEATAQQRRERGENGNGPVTILKNMAAEPAGVAVRVNGATIGDLRTAGYDDITTVVHRGRNTVSVTWRGPIHSLNFRVAYAPTRNNFKSVLVVQADAGRDASLRQSGVRNLAFTIP